MLLAEDGLAEFCNIKQPTTNLKRRKVLMITYIFLFWFLNLSTLIFVIPYTKSLIWPIIQGVLFFLTFGFFCIIANLNPGYLIKRNDISLI